MSETGSHDSEGHISVLLVELVEGVFDNPNGFYVDVTGGAGGHSKELLKKLGENAKLLILDCDPQAVDFLRGQFQQDPRVEVVQASFSGLVEVLIQKGVSQIDGLMADLGYSSRQLDDPQRGLSFLSDGPLDMRLSPDYPESALELLGSLDEEEVAEIIRDYGEERHAKLLSRKIKESLERDEIHTTKDLAELAQRVVGRFYRGQRIHPATRLFQALRIAVNRELEELDALLESLPKVLKEAGRAGIISFHSLEDRRVKHVYKALSQNGFRIITKKPLRPGDFETQSNPRSRSAKLRLIKKNESSPTSIRA